MLNPTSWTIYKNNPIKNLTGIYVYRELWFTYADTTEGARGINYHDFATDSFLITYTWL